MLRILRKQLSKPLKPEYLTNWRKWYGITINSPVFNSEYTSDSLTAYMRVRKEVFIDALGWDLSETNGLEIDQFDHPSTYYSLSFLNGKLLCGARGNRIDVNDNQASLMQVLAQMQPELRVPLTNRDWDVTRLCLNNKLQASSLQKLIGFWAIFNMQKKPEGLLAIECWRYPVQK